MTCASTLFVLRKEDARQFFVMKTLLALLFFFWLTGAATAATFTVTNLNDSGPGSLRQAIVDANNNPGADHIFFATGASSGTITLTSGELLIQSPVDIVGPGPAALGVDANGLSRVFNVAGTNESYGWSSTISGLTISRGAVLGTYNYGGCVRNFAATLTLNNVRIERCTAENGAGLGVQGNSGAVAIVRDSTIENNDSTSFGGGVFNIYAQLTIERSVIRNNAAQTGGGVVISDSSGYYYFAISDSVVTGNSARSAGPSIGRYAGAGGGIVLLDFDGEGATFSLTRTLIANNSAANLGGGVFLDTLTDQTVLFENSTLTGNSALNGGGLAIASAYPPDLSASVKIMFHNATVSTNLSTGAGSAAGLLMPLGLLGTTEFDNTVISGNSGGFDLDASGATVTGKNSFFSMLTGTTNVTGVGNQIAQFAMLGPLADNGGPLVGASGYQARLDSMLPASGSPLIDRGDNALAPPGGTDQRGVGFDRLIGTAIDIGAIEVPAVTTPNAFSLDSQAGVALSTLITSNSITVSGINAAAGISIVGGSYSINGGAYTTAVGSVNNGDTVTVQQTSSGSFSTLTTTTLTIGGVSGAFNVTTLAADTIPGAFSFNAQTGVALSTVTTSNAAQITGINTAANWTASNGTACVSSANGCACDVATWAASGTVSNNQYMCVKQTSSGSFSTTTTATLTVGGVNGPFSITTVAAPTAVTSYTAPSATGSGSITASFSGGGAGCGYTVSRYVPVSSVPVPPPPGVSFEQGLFDFTTSGCTSGSTITMSLVYPQALPPGTVYWKYGPTAGNTTPHWYTVPVTISGNTATFTITDGGLGDDDRTQNGTLVDAGGPGSAATPQSIPTLSEWGMILLSGLIGIFGFAGVRRRAA